MRRVLPLESKKCPPTDVPCDCVILMKPGCLAGHYMYVCFIFSVGICMSVVDGIFAEARNLSNTS